jgi:hypothetical protein
MGPGDWNDDPPPPHPAVVQRQERPAATPPHPARALPVEAPHPAAVVVQRAPHPAMVVGQRAPHPATVPVQRAPHPATVAQPRAVFGGQTARPPHPAIVVQRAQAPSGPAGALPPHPARTVQRAAGGLSVGDWIGNWQVEEIVPVAAAHPVVAVHTAAAASTSAAFSAAAASSAAASGHWPPVNPSARDFKSDVGSAGSASAAAAAAAAADLRADARLDSSTLLLKYSLSLDSRRQPDGEIDLGFKEGGGFPQLHLDADSAATYLRGGDGVAFTGIIHVGNYERRPPAQGGGWVWTGTGTIFLAPTVAREWSPFPVGKPIRVAGQPSAPIPHVPLSQRQKSGGASSHRNLLDVVVKGGHPSDHREYRGFTLMQGPGHVVRCVSWTSRSLNEKDENEGNGLPPEGLAYQTLVFLINEFGGQANLAFPKKK